MSTYLKNKWIGLAVLVLCSLIWSFRITSDVKPMLQRYIPVIMEVSEPFLPISVKNGEITGEARVVKTVLPGNPPLNLVLDTTVNNFNVEDLKEAGIYVSKKDIYIVDKGETKIRSLTSFNDVEIDKKTMEKLLSYMSLIADSLFLIYFLLFFAYISICVIIYSLITYLIMRIFAKTGFSQIFVISSIVYSLIRIFAMLSLINLGSIITLIILVCANYLYVKMSQEV